MRISDWSSDVCSSDLQGISFLLIDMKTPGVTVRPIQTFDGGHEINEVFFDDVRVPIENLFGEENKGWDYAKFLLGNERSGIADRHFQGAAAAVERTGCRSEERRAGKGCGGKCG